MTHPKLDRMTDENLCALVGRDPGAEDCLFLRHIEPVTRFLMGRYGGIEHEAVAAEALLDALDYVNRLYGIEGGMYLERSWSSRLLSFLETLPPTNQTHFPGNRDIEERRDI